MRRGWPSTPRPTGTFMAAWVWRASGNADECNDVPLHLAGNDAGTRKPETAEAKSASSKRRMIRAGLAHSRAG